MKNQWCFNNVEILAEEVVEKVIREWNEFQEYYTREKKEQNRKGRQNENQSVGNQRLLNLAGYYSIDTSSSFMR